MQLLQTGIEINMKQNDFRMFQQDMETGQEVTLLNSTTLPQTTPVLVSACKLDLIKLWRDLQGMKV